MAQLISMKQRIKAVESIKKITNAMRLISMSTFTKLTHKKSNLEKYKTAFNHLWSKIENANLDNQEDIPENKINNFQKKLIIYVGSQKGLCGSFNTILQKFFELEFPVLDPNDEFIAIGKHAIEYFKQKKISTKQTFADFNSNTFVHISNSITNIILSSHKKYSSVILFGNHPKSFFIQKPQKTSLLEIKKPKNINNIEKQEKTTEYIFEQSPKEIAALIKRMMLSVTIGELLYGSLLSEQSARFLSMDSSTRNAEKLLIQIKLEYNKLRQTKITQELTELASSY